jgi:hypothetical protein
MKMKDAYYFPHDSNARHDPKILEMRAAYGAKGYGLFWMIIEILRDQEAYRIKVKDNFYAGLALDLNADKEEIKQFITDCMNEFELLESDGNYVWSNSLKLRMEHLDEKREKARNAANIRWKNEPGKPTGDTDAMQTHCGSNASKVKESKLNTYAKTSDTESELYESDSSILFNFSIKKWEGISDSHRKIWHEAYPDCDIGTELAKMKAWILSAGSKGHKKNWQRFIIGWLSRTREQKGAKTNGSDRKHFENERVYTTKE